MHRWLFSAGMALTQIFPVPFISPVWAQQPSAEDTALLETLITQNEATVRKVESSPLYVDFSWHTTLVMPQIPINGEVYGGPMTVEGKSRYWRHGKSFHQDKDFKNTWTDTGVVRDGSAIFMINDHYAAQYAKGPRELALYIFEDRDNLYPAVINIMDNYPTPDIMEFGFRYSSRYTVRDSFERYVKATPSHTRWKPSESETGGVPQYSITSESQNREGSFKLQGETALDPQSGFLISESRTYDKTGTAIYIVSSQFQRIGDGVWFPKSGVRKIRDNDETMTIQVNDVQLNDPKIDEKFTLEAMDIDRDETIMYEYAGKTANRVMKGFFEGKWVTFDQLPSDRKDTLRRAHSAPTEVLKPPATPRPGINP